MHTVLGLPFNATITFFSKTTKPVAEKHEDKVRTQNKFITCTVILLIKKVSIRIRKTISDVHLVKV